MKSLIFPTRTAVILIPTLVFNPSKSLSSISNFISVRNPKFLSHVRHLRVSLSYSSPSTEENGHFQKTKGEIHVIVGPMFAAGKTTTLLRRVKSESSNGRFVAHCEHKVLTDGTGITNTTIIIVVVSTSVVVFLLATLLFCWYTRVYGGNCKSASTDW
ncbi:hypothetical protein L1887_23161 [Cichorium endivia]|nr:hypothetical protein L1887_23161 [Cichorium endivia]